VRVGDTVEVGLKNADDSWMPHNVDFHAVTGLHGGGHATMADPGQDSKGFTFKALSPGLYVYRGRSISALMIPADFRIRRCSDTVASGT
jgi:hypothetical protein